MDSHIDMGFHAGKIPNGLPTRVSQLASVLPKIGTYNDLYLVSGAQGCRENGNTHEDSHGNSYGDSHWDPYGKI